MGKILKIVVVYNKVNLSQSWKGLIAQRLDAKIFWAIVTIDLVAAIAQLRTSPVERDSSFVRFGRVGGFFRSLMGLGSHNCFYFLKLLLQSCGFYKI